MGIDGDGVYLGIWGRGWYRRGLRKTSEEFPEKLWESPGCFLRIPHGLGGWVRSLKVIFCLKQYNCKSKIFNRSPGI